MNWFRRKSKAPPSPPSASQTYKQRVDAFWNWWSQESERLYAAVDADGGGTISEEVSEAVDRLCPGFGWVFSAGPGGQGHSLTISPEGNDCKRLLTQYWLEKAPACEGWTFYSSRQPADDFAGASLRVGDATVEAKALWITPKVDAENEEIDIIAWSPVFAEIGESQAMQILFLLLDEALGENGTSRWIGSIDIAETSLDRAIPLSELPEFVRSARSEYGWKPEEVVAVVYKTNEPLGDFPRGDVFIGHSQIISLVRAYGRQRGPAENPVASSGAELMFLQIPRANFTPGEEIDNRGSIEEALEDAFADDLGYVVGGATGTDASYIDLILFDGERSHAAIAETLQGNPLANGYQQCPFVK